MRWGRSWVPATHHADSGELTLFDSQRCLLAQAKLHTFTTTAVDKLEHMLERAVGDGGGVLVVVAVLSMEGDVPLPVITATCASASARG